MEKNWILIILFTFFLLGFVSLLFYNIFEPTGPYEKKLVINDEVINYLKNSLDEGESELIFYPSNRRVTLKQGTKNDGFIFAIRNQYLEDKNFYYEIGINEINMEGIKIYCGSISSDSLESWVNINQGSIFLPGNSTNANTPERVLFNIPKNAPKCTIPYTVRIKTDEEMYAEGKVLVTID